MTDSRLAGIRSGAADFAGILLLGLLGHAVAIGLPLGDLRHAVPGELGDTRFVHYLMEHSWRWLAGDPLHADLWRFPTFYPTTERTFLFSELMLSVAPPYWSLRALGASPSDAYVSWLLATSLLNVAAGFAFLRHGIGLSRCAAHLGAFLIAFASYRVHQLPHGQLFAAYLLLVALASLAWYFRRGLDNGVSWPIPVAGAALGAQFWGGFYVAYFGCIALGLVLGWGLLSAPCRRVLAGSVRRHRWAWIAGAALVAATVLPLAALYRSAQNVVGAFDWGAANGAGRLVARPWSWIYMSDRSRLYGWMTTIRPFSGDPLGYETPIGVGWITTAAAAAALWRSRRSMTGRLLGLALVSIVVLATGIPGAKLAPWRLFYELVPGASATRAVVRVGILVPILAAVGVGWVLDRLRREGRIVAALLLGAACVAEQLVAPLRYDAVENERWVGWLSAQVAAAPAAIVVNRPDHRFPPYIAQLDALWAGLEVGKPTVNGYSGSWPPGWKDELWDGVNRTPASRRRFDAKLGQWLGRHGVEPSEVQVIELPRWYRRNPNRMGMAAGLRTPTG